ncbi:MAG: DNA recombination protein RmuC [Lentisphaeraceae bacterium]|nr:DNA recombination protein RmuC [Lentisphaeraceae bacterium]
MQILVVLLMVALGVTAGLGLWAWHLAKACMAARAEAQAQRQRAERAEITLAERERFAEHARAEQQATLQASLKALREQFTNLAARQLEASRAGLAEDNRTRFKALFEPLGAQLEAFRKAFEANRDQQVTNKASFEAALERLNKQTLQISADAEALTKALKSEAKTQGNWGELILENILAAAGLTEGVDYRLQAQETDEAGQKLIPDVEILLPHNEVLLVDSKVSITAYANYMAATDDTARQKAAADHVASVRAHVKELADKDYPGRIRAAQNYILMFIPNEGSYLLALEHDRQLVTEAFRSRVIIVNPTTLLLCLQIAALLRSREAQSEKAEKIISAATKLYEKFASFTDTFAAIGEQLDKAKNAYDTAHKQLSSGRGNITKQLEGFKSLGVVTSKQLNKRLQDAPPADAEAISCE